MGRRCAGSSIEGVVLCWCGCAWVWGVGVGVRVVVWVEGSGKKPPVMWLGHEARVSSKGGGEGNKKIRG